ncbi:hypothetical protein TNCV_4327681 [Trichonephila clavipes]|nr:hypothetical protein TNCV_4327681 [Trichonephila clavipes]
MVHSVVSYRVLKMEVNKEKIRYILQFFFDKGENASQLNRLKLMTDQKWPELSSRRGLVFHQENATQHTFVEARQRLWALGWKVSMRPPYSPDLAPNAYPPFSHIAKLPE